MIDKEKRNEAEYFVKKMIENEKNEQIIRQNILNNSQYMDWLFEFTERYPAFSDCDWLYNQNAISKEDQSNIDELCVLFSIIHDYAYRNYLPSFGNGYFEYYSIVDHNVGYNIGKNLIMMGPIYGCERSEINNDFICFDDIRNNYIKEETIKKDILLSNFEQTIENLYKSGIPLDRIKETVNNYIDNNTKSLCLKLKK